MSGRDRWIVPLCCGPAQRRRFRSVRRPPPPEGPAGLTGGNRVMPIYGGAYNYRGNVAVCRSTATGRPVRYIAKEPGTFGLTDLPSGLH